MLVRNILCIPSPIKVYIPDTGHVILGHPTGKSSFSSRISKAKLELCMYLLSASSQKLSLFLVSSLLLHITDLDRSSTPYFWVAQHTALHFSPPIITSRLHREYRTSYIMFVVSNSSRLCKFRSFDQIEFICDLS